MDKMVRFHNHAATRTRLATLRLYAIRTLLWRLEYFTATWHMRQFRNRQCWAPLTHPQTQKTVQKTNARCAAMMIRPCKIRDSTPPALQTVQYVTDR